MYQIVNLSCEYYTIHDAGSLMNFYITAMRQEHQNLIQFVRLENKLGESRELVNVEVISPPQNRIAFLHAKICVTVVLVYVLATAMNPLGWIHCCTFASLAQWYCQSCNNMLSQDL